MPGSCYAPNDKTIDGLYEAIAADFSELFERGVTVEVAKLITQKSFRCYACEIKVTSILDNNLGWLIFT